MSTAVRSLSPKMASRNTRMRSAWGTSASSRPVGMIQRVVVQTGRGVLMLPTWRSQPRMNNRK